MTDDKSFIPDEGLAPASSALPGAAGPLQEIAQLPRNKWLDVWEQFKHHKGALYGGILFFTLVLVVFLGPLVWPYDATYIDIRARNQGPGLAHPLGTDQLGRDTLARMMAGGQTSVSVGITAMLLALFLGSLVGVVAGYFKRLDGILMRMTDLFLALPLLPLLPARCSLSPIMALERLNSNAISMHPCGAIFPAFGRWIGGPISAISKMGLCWSM